MPRKARVLVPNCPHHIVQRGHNRKAVFLDDQDYQYYIENLKEWKEALGLKIYAWCLMTNHIHLVIEPGEDVGAISTLMKRVNGRQAAYVNKLEGRSGSLWEGRFKASPIERDAYLLACLRYVELNPLKARMVERLEHYPWSSYHERKGVVEWPVMDYDEIYLSLGENSQKRWASYRKFLSESISEKELNLIQQSVQRNQLTGGGRFTDEVQSRIGIRVERRGRGRPSKAKNKCAST